MKEMNKAEKFLQLEKELTIYKKMMKDAGAIIINERVSDYPIFIAHQQHVEIGIPIAEKGKVKGNWNINATTLEEMVSKQIIKPENIEEFKDVYKPIESHVCVFILSELGAQFAFLKVE